MLNTLFREMVYPRANIAVELPAPLTGRRLWSETKGFLTISHSLDPLGLEVVDGVVNLVVSVIYHLERI